jgi:hypothetical protein
MRHMLQILGTLPLLGMLAASLTTANAMEIQRSGSAPYDCIAVEGGNTANGTPVIASSCSGGPEDRWNYINGQFQGLGTFNGASMCLDVKGQGTTAGTVVTLSTCTKTYTWQYAWYGVGCALVGSYGGGPQVGVISWGIEACLDSSGGPAVTGGTQLVINENCQMGVPPEAWNVR